LESLESIDSSEARTILGISNSEQFGKTSLVCDFQELYRYLIDDFIIQYCKKLNRNDFSVKSEHYSTKRKGKREYLNGSKTKDFVKELNQFFRNKVMIPLIRLGAQEEIETLINEETFLLAKYLRDEKPTWTPIIVSLS
jgi:CRISPR/Cas system-associated endonuclease Cas1